MSRRTGIAAALVLVVGALALALFTAQGGSEFQAEFADVHGLGARGNEVRVNGASVGTVSALELTPRGTILMTGTLTEDVPQLRRDAAAAIRPVDIFGDYYISLSPGSAPEPLRGPIGLRRTAIRPQLDDVLRAFGPPVRGGLQALIVELGKGLERRGVDLNRAAVELRPAVTAGESVVRELASQRAGLRSLVADAERATAQLARRDRELGRTTDAMAVALGAAARRRGDLDRGLREMPPTLRRLERVAGELEATARTARPAVDLVGRSAPGLQTVLERTPRFLRETERTARATRPALRRSAALLPDLSRVADDLAEALPRLTAVGPEMARLAEAGGDAAPDLAEGLLVGVPEAVSEPGRQPSDGPGDVRRRLLRTANVLTCESFGRPIERGCLDGVAGVTDSSRGRDGASGGRARPAAGDGAKSARPAASGRSPNRAGAPPSREKNFGSGGASRSADTARTGSDRRVERPGAPPHLAPAPPRDVDEALLRLLLGP